MPDPFPQGSTKPVHPSSRFADPWLYPLLACFILVALLSLRKIGSYDLGFHLKGGQWIVQNLSFPQKDTFTYTQTGRDYLDANCLYQILLYGFYRVFGYSSLTLLNSGIVLVVFFLLWLRLKRSQASPWMVCLLFLVAVLGMERRFIPRPEVFSWLYLSLTLWILDQRFWRRGNLLYLLPLIQWLWVNTEGLFPLGWAALGIYLLSGWFHEKRFDPLLTRYSLLSVAVGFLNPYGLRGFLFPFILWTRLQASSLYKQTIAEFLSPWQALKTQNLAMDSHLNLFLFFGAGAVCLLLITLTFRQRKLHEIFIVIIFLFLALTALRNIPLFWIVALPVLPNCLVDLKKLSNHPSLSGLPAAFGLAFFVILWCLRVATNAYYISDRRNDRMGLGLDPQVLPIKAVQFLTWHGLDGKMINDLDSGGWLDWQAPQATFMDGRLEVPEDSFYRQVLQSYLPGGLIPLLAASQAQLAVVEYNSMSPWVDQLNRFSNWRLVYLDENTAIYARQDYAPWIPALSFDSLLTSRGITSGGEADTELQNLNPSKFKSWLRGIYLPQTYAMGYFSMGLFALHSKAYGPSRDLLMEGFRRTNGDYSEVFFNLALADLHLGDFESGRRCLGYTLELDPQNEKTLQILEQLQKNQPHP